MVLTSIMGMPYKFTNLSWKRFLQKWVADGDVPDIHNFAVCINDKPIKNITDWDTDDAEDALEDLE